MTKLIATLFASLLFVDIAMAGSEPDNLEQLAEQALLCTRVDSRVERLGCYDDVFSSSKTHLSEANAVHHSEPWLRAMKSESNRQSQHGWLRNELTDPEGNTVALWLTVPAEKKESQQADTVLMASCVNNISRLELILPHPQQGARAEISLGSQRQRWTYDEQGIVLRSGRGLDAILLMRPLMHKDTVKVRSNVPELDGIEFKTPNSNSSFSELKGLCRW